MFNWYKLHYELRIQIWSLVFFKFIIQAASLSWNFCFPLYCPIQHGGSRYVPCEIPREDGVAPQHADGRAVGVRLPRRHDHALQRGDECDGHAGRPRLV